MPDIIELRPDKGLLYPNFEKYQFLDEPILILEKDLETEVLRVEPSSSQDSWLEARSFAYHNHLYKNPFNGKCYFVNKDNELWKLDTNGFLELVHTLTKFSIESGAPVYNPSLSFASEDIIVGCNGCKNLEIIIKNDSQPLLTFVFEDIDAGIILDSVYVEDKSIINVVMCFITEIESKKHSEVVLYTYSSPAIDTVGSEPSSLGVKFIGKRILRVKGAVDYANLESNGNYLHLMSQDSATFVYDSLRPVNKEIPAEGNQEINIPKYCWSQDEDSLTIWLKVFDGIDKSQIKVDVKPNNIVIKYEDQILMAGESGHRLDPDLTTWSHEKDSLKIDLFKNETGLMWNELIKGDTGGECLPNEALAAEVHSRLAYLCTEEPGTGGGHPMLGFNSEQLEECDIQERENQFQRINIDSHKTTHLVILGANNCVLFTQRVKHGQLLCLRHDHDGCVWVAGESNDEHWRLKHISTFPGFGYVEASKTNKKFCVSPPNGSYVAIVEHARHVFLYEKPVGNSKIGHQRIVDLGCEVQANPVLGAAASNRYLYLLTKNKLYQLQMNP
ncbi:nudC domain-containing protein 1 isoform X1 [Neodiprion virginianus]|uniref:nudC domain-containing protein 1 isoform X1 n=1 Tax=Neodiprion virginianus TaxID=2961670 RepID=UPI001EE6AD46|nr:nudC domain-containing protein 1 isoform X1 [Neodiprion virginianus]